MKSKEGPMLSALIIGAGVGFLVFQRFENPIYGLGAGLAIGLADYFLMNWVNSWRQKK